MSDVELLTKGGWVSLVAVMVVVVPVLVKGLYALTRGRAQSRKEFLDIWDRRKIDDSLWLETAVMHAFGDHPPASVIRGVLLMPEPRRTLRDLSENWRYFDGDDVSSIHWKTHRRNNTWWRRGEIGFFLMLYLALGTFGFFVINLEGPSAVLLGVALFALAMASLAFVLKVSTVSDVLSRVASRAADRRGVQRPASHGNTRRRRRQQQRGQATEERREA